MTIGVHDPELPGSEKVKVFVVLKVSSRGNVGADEIVTHCREKLPPYAIPQLLEFRESLLLTVTQKLFKKR